ncbi:LysR family substrate-binding domain-containing protein [Rhodococcus sp. IEGM 248]|uniref:LysR family substrate-binding domain-containing protein n=1 Tax=Rhodococcus opacus TaxID=37919 RepID=UPI0013C186D2|nr:LysR family substrate-binding domain-containing protein [Rhodococcus opacus]MDV7086135.1 LysR family substrate-binding domain-containing protein [Rhodococcus opacus]NDV05075.1 LysR family substrate-binding domain-containing protein [Rhodococcus sp. IEGM 248]
MTDADASPSFRLAYVPGVTPTKWVRIWNERLPDVPLTLVPVAAADAPDQLRGGGADAGLVRLPIDRTGLSAIPLYTEIPVVVAPKDHVVAAVDEVSIADLADEIVLHPLDDVLVWDSLPGLPAQDRPATTADAIELVAAGIGLLVVPQSLARLHHRKDLVYRTVSDGPESRIALSWPEDETTELVEEFIGIVRGRTVNSSRGRTPTPAQPKKKRPAAAAARQKPAPGARTSRSGSGAKGGKKGKPRRRS